MVTKTQINSLQDIFLFRDTKEDVDIMNAFGICRILSNQQRVISLEILTLGFRPLREKIYTSLNDETPILLNWFSVGDYVRAQFNFVPDTEQKLLSALRMEEEHLGLIRDIVNLK